jgi:glycosyltransferase involved in cell wall biosynthesis
VTPSNVSVAICTRNRPASLRRCIASICAQEATPLEVIVVDDGVLADDIRSLLQQDVERLGILWTYLSKSEPGLTRSRNVALSAARGQIVQFLDDDVELGRGFLAEITAVFALDSQSRIGVIGGDLIEPAMGSLGGRLWQAASTIAGWWRLGRRGMARDRWPDRLSDRGRVVPSLRLSGAALAVRREVVWPPGFDEALKGYALGEDRDICYLVSRSRLVGRATRAVATHHADPQGRLRAREFGYSTGYNYCYILNKYLSMGVGEWTLVFWSLMVLGVVRLIFALAGEPRRHLGELVGMIEGAGAWGRRCLRQDGFCW